MIGYIVDENKKVIHKYYCKITSTEITKINSAIIINNYKIFDSDMNFKARFYEMIAELDNYIFIGKYSDKIFFINEKYYYNIFKLKNNNFVLVDVDNNCVCI